MSSITWTAEELSSNFKRRSSKCWRVVEAQHINSTLKLVDGLKEQERLEDLLDDSKPKIPEELKNHDYLIFTPFRYRPYPRGSRFRREGQKEGVFYGAETPETAVAEKAHQTLQFFRESPDTPVPDNAIPHTAFQVAYSTAKLLDLTEPPFDVNKKIWTHPDQYEPCQQFADEARKANTEVLKTHSVRCKSKGINIVILSPKPFKELRPTSRQTWSFTVSKNKDKVIALSEFPSSRIEFEC